MRAHAHKPHPLHPWWSTHRLRSSFVLSRASGPVAAAPDFKYRLLYPVENVSTIPMHRLIYSCHFIIYYLVFRFIDGGWLYNSDTVCVFRYESLMYSSAITRWLITAMFVLISRANFTSVCSLALSLSVLIRCLLILQYFFFPPGRTP